MGFKISGEYFEAIAGEVFPLGSLFSIQLSILKFVICPPARGGGVWVWGCVCVCVCSEYKTEEFIIIKTKKKIQRRKNSFI